MHLPQFVLVAAFLVASTRVSAQAPSLPEPAPAAYAIPKAENARRLTMAYEVMAGLGLEVVASMGAVGTGLGVGAAVSSPDEHGDAVFLDARGERTFAAVALVSALALVPPATALGVNGVGRARGHGGSYRTTWLYSLVGGAGLGAVTLGIAWPALAPNHDDPAMGAMAIAGGVSFVGFLAGAMLGQQHSRHEHRGSPSARTRLTPVISAGPGNEHVALGLHGTF